MHRITLNIHKMVLLEMVPHKDNILLKTQYTHKAKLQPKIKHVFKFILMIIKANHFF